MNTFLFFAISVSVALAGWTRRADMLQARSDAEAVIYGKWIFIGGGCTQNQTTTGYCPNYTEAFEMYNVDTDTWTPLPNLPRQRYRHETVLINDTIYFIGGRTLPDDAIIQEMDIYNITNQTWSTVLQTVQLTSDGTAFNIGNKIYYTGGYNVDYSATSNETLLLDLDVGNQFEADMVPQREIRSGDCWSVELNGLGYVFGGFTTENSFSAPLNTMEVYDPQSGWTTLQPFLTARGDLAGAALNGLLYIIGGESKDANGISYPVANVEVFYPTKDTWRALTPIAESRFRFTSVNYETIIYDIGGQLAEVDPTGGQDPYYPITKHVYSYNTSGASASMISSLLLLIVAFTSIVNL